MIVDFERKIIFVHIQRTGGTSLKKAYRSICRSNLVNGTNIVIRERSRAAHWPIHKVMEFVKTRSYDGNFSDWFKFTYVRHPLSWMQSQYRFILANRQHPQHSQISSLDNLEEFILWYLDKRNEMRGPICQLDFLVLPDGGIGVDQIFRLEEFEAGLDSLSERIGCALPFEHKNASPGSPTQHTLSSRCLDQFRNGFAKDFETLGYE